MFQLQPHKAAHHQNNQIAHYAFENALLQQRNALLNQENQKLLEELQHSHQQLQDPSYLNFKALIEEQKEIIQLASKGLNQLKTSLPAQTSKALSQLVCELNNTRCEQVNLMKLFEGLLSLIKDLSTEFQDLKFKRIKHKLAEKEERLQIRKQARQNTQRVLHIVKEPDEVIRGFNSKIFHEQLNHQRELFQRVLSKVRKDEVSIKHINKLFDLMDRSKKLRLNLKMQECQLSILQRQFQLGWIEPATLQQTISALERGSLELKEVKRAFEEQLQQL